MSFKTTISTSRRALWLFLLLFLYQASQARVSIFMNDRPVEANAISLRYYFDTSRQVSFQRFLAIQNHLQPVLPANIEMSYKNGAFWLTLDLSKLSAPEFDYLLVHNPHINFLAAWIVQGDSLIKAFTFTGDHLPFSSRPVHHSQFVYPLPMQYRKATLVLLVDKRNEQLHLPVYFFSADTFIRHNRNNNIFTGLLTGISIFILLFTLFLYLNIREKLYVFYALYVLLIAGYIFSDAGLSFMLLYPNAPFLADFSRPLTVSVAPVMYILFARNLLNVKENFPQLYRFSNLFITFFAVLFVLAFALVPGTGSLRTFWLILMQVVTMLSIVPVFIFGIAAYRKGVKYAGYVIIASTFLTVFAQVYTQYLSGNLPETLLTRNAVSIGFTIEICLLALALSIRFKNYKEEAEGLLRRLALQQEAIFKNISEYQEKEMKRISGLLHDTVGAGLSSIKYNLESVQNNPGKNSHLLKSTIEDVTVLTDEIRNISHNLSPLLLQKKGLLKALDEMIGKYNRAGNVQILLESIGSLHAASFQHEILIFRIIQELLHNAIKHAFATEIMIQLMLEPEIVSVFVEDNGRGFDRDTVKEGLGFLQIKGLVTFVNGQFAVDSQLNRGCRVSIEFPVIPHEWNHQRFTGRRPPYVSGGS